MQNKLDCGFYVRRASHKRIKKTGVYNNGELTRCSMMPCQREMFDDYDKTFVIDNAPPGSGKSTTIKFVHADNLTRHRDQKLVISIPQTIISKTFQKVELEYPDGSIIYWDIDQDLCDDAPNKVNKIVKFLNTTEFAEGVNQRVLICTHSALAQAYHKLKNKSAAFVNTTLTIDEAHRLLCAENGNASVANQLGSIINHLVSSNPEGFRVWLATATFFRGDKLSILKEKVREQFSIRYLPMDRHWEENVRHLESYTYDFIVYKHKPWNEIKALLSKDKKKTVIFCPAQNRPLADGCKYTFVANLKKHIYKVRPGARILDLVNESGREKRKKILFSDKTAKDIDIVLAVNIFDEGADWVFGEQAIDLTPSNSLRVIVQRFGRIIRDVIGKKDVNYYTFLPFVLDQLDEEEYRKTLSKHFAAFTASLLLEEYIKPVEIPKPKNKNQEESNGAYINYFVQEVPDENKRGKIINKAQKNLIALKALVSSPTLKQTQQCIIDALKDCGVKKYRNAISKQIAFMWRRRLTIDGQDISWMLSAGFDKIWKDDIYDILLKFGSGVCGKKMFEEFRDVFKKLKSPEEWVIIAEQLAKDNNGILYHGNWLVNSGYNGLAQCIYRYPHLFEHIPQKKMYVNPEEWVIVAEKLAVKNKGRLPHCVWLLDNGYSPLYEAVLNHPEFFQHIVRDKKIRSAEEWVIVAEKLSKEHGGILPHKNWLEKNGYGNLPHHLRNTSLFDHIPQDSKLGKTANQHLVIAQKLSEEHGGKLPCKRWLVDNGYNGLVQCKQKYPELFQNIEQENKKGKSVHNHVSIAKKLAAENGKILPSNKWLSRNGYDSLIGCMQKYPEFFEAIKKEGQKSDLEEHLKTAEKWIKNRGILPYNGWLIKNGHCGLAQCIKKYPTEFREFKQEYRGGKSPADWVPVAKKLALENGGSLPPASWLIKHGYCGIYNSIKKRPELFRGIIMQRRPKSLEDHVNKAKELANNNVLPCASWLVRNGHGDLYAYIKKYPQKFKNIKISKRRRSPQDWVLVAKRLAQENSGALPTFSWLENNGYSGLPHAIRDNPNVFKDVKLTKNRRSPEEWVLEAEKLSKEHDGLPGYDWLVNNGYSGLAKVRGKYSELFKHIKRQNK